jgi:hypothetical protein
VTSNGVSNGASRSRQQHQGKTRRLACGFRSLDNDRLRLHLTASGGQALPRRPRPTSA